MLSNKRLKKNREFEFLDISKEEFIKELNNEFPISINKIERIVKRVQARYPFIEEHEVKLIVRMFFESLRDFLILGYAVDINKCFNKMKLYFFTHVRDGITKFAVKAQVNSQIKKDKT